MIDEEKSTYIDQSRQENANYKEVIIDIKKIAPLDLCCGEGGGFFVRRSRHLKPAPLRKGTGTENTVKQWLQLLVSVS